MPGARSPFAMSWGTLNDTIMSGLPSPLASATRDWYRPFC